MKNLKDRIRRSLAVLLSVCTAITSIPMVSFASVDEYPEEITFRLSGEILSEDAEKAINKGKKFRPDTLEFTDEFDIGNAKAYYDMFSDEDYYTYGFQTKILNAEELEEYSKVGLRLFVRVPVEDYENALELWDEATNSNVSDSDADSIFGFFHNEELEYELTGNEELIFLYTNSSEYDITFQTEIDGFYTTPIFIESLTKDVVATPSNASNSNADEKDATDSNAEYEDASNSDADEKETVIVDKAEEEIKESQEETEAAEEETEESQEATGAVTEEKVTPVVSKSGRMVQVLATKDGEEDRETSLEVTSIEVLDPTPVNSCGNIQLINNSNVTDAANSRIKNNTVAAAEVTTFGLVRSGGEAPTVITSASTKDFIELNLYDYGSNINDKYSADKNNKENKIMPGFQWNGGAQYVNGSYNWKQVDCIDFGNSVITDLDWGEKINTAVAGATTINGLIEKPDNDYANYPVGTSAGQNILLKTLKNDYPALSDGTSLSYLFKNGDYARKQNTENIDGLFQYDSTTGEYWYRSRDNHAQYSNNTFTLYDDKITPNFILYPFGNFLPFNKIDDLSISTHVKEITNGYNYIQGFINETDNLRKVENSKSATYEQLFQMLANYRNGYLNEYSGTETAADMASDFFTEGGPADVAFTLNDFQDLYNIDYTEPKNFFFGMEMKMNFMQPKGGLTGKDGQTPMVFEFSGDDDVWVYIDDVLFLDLSGIHRHVSGKIDFVNGKVTYYALDPSEGDTGATAFKTFTFKEILSAAGKDTSVLKNGRFKDYTYHDFNFYYMERGSGSSVCEINFNFPLLRRNSISVKKELTVDNGTGKEDLLGDKSFDFQIFKADSSGNKTDELFIGANTIYNVYDENGTLVSDKFETDENGIFALKPGQRAEFLDIQENSGKYFVRELLDPTEYDQYGSITVSGESTTTVNNVTVGSTKFTGVDSPVKDASDGVSIFQFNNKVTFNDLGNLEISKTLKSHTDEIVSSNQEFKFQVKLNGTDLPVGTKYMVAEETKVVTTVGEVVVPAGSKAVISNIFLGSTFEVKEKAESSGNYTVTYSLDGDTVDGANVTGEIKEEGQTVNVNATNKVNGVDVHIPVKKTLTNGDGIEHSYKVQLVQVADENGTALTDAPAALEQIIKISDTDKCSVSGNGFTYTYLSTETNDGDTFYYKLTEVVDEGLLDAVAFDTASYIVQVTINKDQNTFGATTTWYKNGEKLADDGVNEAEFINTLLGSIRIKKRVDGTTNDPTKEFDFKVSVDRGTLPNSDSSDVSGTYSSYLLEGENQSAAIKLAADEYIEIKKIPLGTVVTVEETGIDGYEVSWNDNVIVDVENSGVATATICSNDTTKPLEFLCTNKDIEGDLVLRKIVKNIANAEATGGTFQFKVTLDNGDAAEYDYILTKSDGTSNNGKVKFTVENGKPVSEVIEINHEDQYRIIGLPSGVKATITELKTDGYWVEWSDGDAVEGTDIITTENDMASASGTIRNDNALIFVCTNQTGTLLPATGGTGTTPYRMSGLLSIIVAAGYLLISEKKNLRKEEKMPPDSGESAHDIKF